MYAVVVTGGKQYRVEEGQTLKVEKLEVATGEAVEIEKVLLIGNGDDVKIGQPVVEGAKVSAEVVAPHTTSDEHVRTIIHYPNIRSTCCKSSLTLKCRWCSLASCPILSSVF